HPAGPLQPVRAGLRAPRAGRRPGFSPAEGDREGQGPQGEASRRLLPGGGSGEVRTTMKTVMLLTLMLSGLPLRAAEPRPQPSPLPRCGAGAAAVTVPVYVSGGGRPVVGLRAEDFEVLDEGRPVKLIGFQEIAAGAPPAPGVVGGPPQAALAAR